MLIDTLKRDAPETVFPFDVSPLKIKDAVTFFVDQYIHDFIPVENREGGSFAACYIDCDTFHLPYRNTFIQLREGGVWVIEEGDTYFITAFPAGLKSLSDCFTIREDRCSICVVFEMRLNRDANTLEYRTLITPEGEIRRKTTSYTVEIIRQTALVFFALVLRFVYVLSCKNIRAVKVAGAPKRKRHKKPLHSYYILQIQSSVKPAKGNIKKLWSNRVHLCRGHVKTYTPDKPLFGHYVGNVWCPPHAKGNREIGVVHKEYALC